MAIQGSPQLRVNRRLTATAGCSVVGVDTQVARLARSVVRSFVPEAGRSRGNDSAGPVPVPRW